MATLSPQDLVNLASQTIGSRVIGTDAKGELILAHYKQPASRSLDVHIPKSEMSSRVIRAASIMLAESGGKTDAFRPAAQNPGGGNDRGLWQINDKAHPDVSDQAAFDPTTSTEIAYQLSQGFKSWGPWHGSPGLDPASQPSQTIAKTYKDMTGYVVDDTPILSQIDPNADLSFAPILGWAEALGRFLSHLIDPTFWKRVGIGALGVLLAAFGLTALVKDSLPKGLPIP